VDYKKQFNLKHQKSQNPEKPAKWAGTRFTYPAGMEGSVDELDLAVGYIRRWLTIIILFADSGVVYH